MPYRKTGSTPSKITQERTKGRQKKEKPILKTPTVIKVKIPSLKATNTNIENPLANQAKVTKNDIEIMLANEVIRAQFPKKLTPSKEPIEESKKNKPIKKATSKKPKLIQKHVLRNTKMVVECIKREPIKRRGRKISKKIDDKLPDNITPEDPIENIVVSPKSVKKETSTHVKLKRKKPVKAVDTSVEAKVSPKNKSQPIKPKAVVRRQLSVNSTPGPLTRKRKLDDSIKEVKEEVLSTDVTEEVKVISINIQNDSLNSKSSSVSELSWTKDISSSSTTSCITVSSHDFFRIDKKLPLIKLSNIDCKSSDQICKNVSDSCCPENNVPKIQNNWETYTNISCPSLNLSASLSCDTYSQGVQSPQNVTNKLDETLKKLSSKLKNLDLEVINWIGCTNEKTNSNIDILNDKMVQGESLKEEREIIISCKEINRIFSKKTNFVNTESTTEIPVTNQVEEIVKICDELVLSKDIHNEENRKTILTETDNCSNNSMGKQNILLEDNDDDDALSLFAESITGIDSSKRNSSVAGILDLPEVEEYIPKPVFRDTFKSPEITYRPSRIPSIDRSNVEHNITAANFCEKQNADSTSIYKENDNSVFVCEDRIGDFSKNFRSNKISQNSSLPRLMASIHKPKQGIHSCVFRGVCFFYLISSCKKTICNFLHKFIEVEDVKKKLALISEHLFIEEYMMVRTWPQLRRMYGKCFVEECVKRELSRFLVEMAIDFVIKSKENSREDNILKIEVIETILLYLNKVDLNTCADLLNYEVQNFKRVLLCDFFMNTIAESQNFSQFKTVFINLTEFMCNIQRTFNINVATLILERVSILPYDEGLARALIKIINNTDIAILSNSMIGKLEMQLMSSNVALYDELISLHEKNQTSHPVLTYCYDTIPNEVTSIKINNNLVTNNNIRYSPDTTNLDNVNKNLEPIITRTIDLKKCNNWTSKTVFDNIRQKQVNKPMMPPKWPGHKLRSDRNLKTRLTNYHRRNGQGFSQDF